MFLPDRHRRPALSAGLATTGQFGAWTPIGAAAKRRRLSGRLEDAVTDQYIAWSVDGGGTSFPKSALSAQALARIPRDDFQPGSQRRRDDRVTTASIEPAGSTTLTKVADSILRDYDRPSPVQLRYGGMSVARASWAPGFRSAWSRRQAGIRSPGRTAPRPVSRVELSTAAALSSLGGVVSGASCTRSRSSAMHQDLNGDGTTGAVRRGSYRPARRS